MYLNKFVDEVIEKDRKIFFNDLKSIGNENNLNSADLSENKDVPLITDFTEYNPFHLGHLYNLKLAKEKVPDGIFVAIVPGLFERSGRGIPYIMTRYARSKIAISLGADIVVEGPPMGIMGSGQYSLSLSAMFKSLNTDYIPRGYKPFKGFQLILDRISNGFAVSPKPYKIIDFETKEVFLDGKLEEDNYVIASLSKSMNKIGFNFKNKFIFIKRIENVSGTAIRQAIEMENFDNLSEMVPNQTISILKREIAEHQAPLHNLRSTESILYTVNNCSYDELISLNLLDKNTANNILKMRENEAFTSLDEVINSISQGFSTHFQNRILSVLEARINKNTISHYIDNYPSIIRVLNYKSNRVLKIFKEKINRRVELW
ncbi:MAG: nucleotidyltransferase family protein [Methanobrevibacter sp.]|jgi:predicted nucleotidyltransferase|nr:nucleotidyltransferase family protein [Methanobrevibacter sp.]